MCNNICELEKKLLMVLSGWVVKNYLLVLFYIFKYDFFSYKFLFSNKKFIYFGFKNLKFFRYFCIV